jgi:hypothetical protein
VRPDEILAATREKFLGVFRVPSAGASRNGASALLADKSRVYRTFDLDRNGTGSEFNRFFIRWLAGSVLFGDSHQLLHLGKRGPAMKMTYATLKSEPDKPVETRLWQAVVLSTIQEWISGPLRYKREAEKYLFQDPKDFPLVCQQAGLDVDRLRAQLTRLRAQVAPLGHADPLGVSR